MYTPAVLLIHICCGMVSLFAGTIAMSVRKGSGPHAAAGNVFVIAMSGMGVTGAYVALARSQMHNVFGGILAVYLVITAWMTGRRREAKTSAFDVVALVFALVTGIAIMTYGVQVLQMPAKARGGVPAGMYLFLGSVALLSAAGDVRMIVRGGIVGARRIARHLWRMCFALFIASGSFFMGRFRLFPVAVQKSGVLFFLTVLPLLLMIFWLIRVRRKKTIGSVPADAFYGG